MIYLRKQYVRHNLLLQIIFMYLKRLLERIFKKEKQKNVGNISCSTPALTCQSTTAKGTTHPEAWILDVVFPNMPKNSFILFWKMEN